jgi:hypothetical protein
MLTALVAIGAAVVFPIVLKIVVDGGPRKRQWWQSLFGGYNSNGEHRGAKQSY